jgi:hypothetical protein
MKLIKLSILLAILNTTYICKAQIKSGDGYVQDIEMKYLGTHQLISDDVEINPELISIVSKNESENIDELRKVKELALKYKREFLNSNKNINSSYKKTRGNEPILVSGFDAASSNTSTPPDNSIAINTLDQLIIVANGIFKVFKGNGASLQVTKNLATFFNPLGTALLTTRICDPKVMYDNQADRFIVFGQTCEGESASSQVLFAFSKTNNATGEWNYYALTGNPLNNSMWFDYPKMGISDHDVYVSGNLFSDAGAYSSSVVYQIDKLKCYAGSTLASGDSKVWSNITGDPFTIVPLSNGQQGGYGNNMYLACKGSAKIKLYEISNAVQNSPTITLTNVTIPASSSPGDALQNGTTSLLDVGDGRSMDGFYLNGTIHFVFHCDGGNGFSAINYTRMSKVGGVWTPINKIIKETGIDLTYPSIASMGFGINDQSSILSVNYSSSTDFPGIKAIFCDNNFTPSNPIITKTGGGSISFGSGDPKRWGDYSSCAKDYTQLTPTVYSFSCAGSPTGIWSNRVSKLRTPFTATGSLDTKANTNEMLLYPNPVINRCNIDIELPESGILIIDLISIDGKNNKLLFKGTCSQGKHNFSFNTSTFANGNYIIQIKNNSKLLTNKKITINK